MRTLVFYKIEYPSSEVVEAPPVLINTHKWLAAYHAAKSIADVLGWEYYHSSNIAGGYFRDPDGIHFMEVR